MIGQVLGSGGGNTIEGFADKQRRFVYIAFQIYTTRNVCDISVLFTQIGWEISSELLVAFSWKALKNPAIIFTTEYLKTGLKNELPKKWNPRVRETNKIILRRDLLTGDTVSLSVSLNSV